MFRNYLKLAIRHLLQQKMYSFITIIGLAIGLAVSLILFLYIRQELSYDDFFPDKQQIYLVQSEVNRSGHVSRSGRLPVPFTEHLSRIPEIQSMATISGGIGSRGDIHYQNQEFSGGNIVVVNSDFLSVLQFPMQHGSRENVLNQPYSIVLTHALAQRIFGEEDPIGKTLHIDEHDFHVSGVLAPLPKTSTIQFDGLVSNMTAQQLLSNFQISSWWSYSRVFIKLPLGVQLAEIEDKLKSLMASVKPEQQKGEYSFQLVNLKDVYFASARNTVFGQAGDIRTIYIFGAIAFLVLIIASINFMNLTVARSTRRTKEVSVRKVVGAYRAQLLKQFLGESFLTAFIALLLAMVLVELLLPEFNAITGQSLNVVYIGQGAVLHWFLLIALVVGVLSGSYPAIFLSGFQPMAVLKGRFGLPRESYVRRGLITLQFTISIGLVICIGLIFRQMQYIQDKDLGFQTENIMQLPNGDISTSPGNYERFKSNLLEIPAVQNVTASFRSVGLNLNSSMISQDTSDQEYNFQWVMVDYDYFETYEIPIIVGRSFSQEHPSDYNNAFILNQAAVSALGLDNPIGKQLNLDLNNRTGQIIGVVADYHHENLYETIEPTIYHLMFPAMLSSISVKLHPESIQTGIQQVEALWSEMFPGFDFKYTFVEETLSSLYVNDRRFGTIVGSLSAVSVLLAAMGIFGLAAYSATQRQREIGIRKVLGATTTDVLTFLTRDYYILLGVAFILGSLISYLSIQRWLAQFAYHTRITPDIFLLTGIALAAIVSFSVGFHAVKSARTNPVQTIRYE